MSIRQGCLVGILLVFVGTNALRAGEIDWRTDYNAGCREAKEKNRPILLDFGNAGCFWCKKLDATTFRKPEIVRRIGEHFVAIKVDGDKYPALVQSLGISSYPTLIFTNADGEIVAKHEGYAEAPKLNQLIDRVLNETGSKATPQPDSAIATIRTPSLTRSPTPLRVEPSRTEGHKQLTQAREDDRTGQYLVCLERCKAIAADEPGTDAAAEARALAAKIKADPEKARLLRESLSETLAELDLAGAETAIRQGRLTEATELLERIQRASPQSRTALVARHYLTQLKARPPVARGQSD
jgi:thioredoxin-related protein